MTRKVDLDVKLAARGEITREPVIVTFRGTEWTFKPSLPAAVLEVAAEGKVMSALLLVLEPSQHADFKKLDITVDEIAVMYESLIEIYGVSLGESSASD